MNQPIRPHWSRIAHAKPKQRGEMNKLEASYASNLEDRKSNGEVLWFAFEAVTFTLTRGVKGGLKGSRLTIDFLVLLADGTLEAHEVKGFRETRQINALKMAAELFPFRFVLVEKRLVRDGGGWRVTEV